MAAAADAAEARSRQLVLWLCVIVPSAFVCVLAALLFLFPGAVGWRVFSVPSAGMEQTLPKGSYVAARPGDPARGDVVVHESRVYGGGPEQTFVKRVIGRGGDEIGCCTGGAVTVDGVALDEPYLFEDDAQPFGPVVVPAGRLFLMGDHRSASSDSRSYLGDGFSGTVAETDVVGIVDGPRSRAGAHLQPVLRHVPHLLGVGLLLAVVLLAVTRVRRG